MIVFLLLLCLSFSTAEDEAHPRYNSLISAQCKARCLYEYRTYHQQQRSLPSMFVDGKSKRLLTGTVLTLPWRSIWERCPRLTTCSSCLVPCDLEPTLVLANEQSCQAICSTLKSLECERSCLFVRKLYQQPSNCSTGTCQFCSSSDDCSEKIPQLYNVTATERKSRRTVKLKWKSHGGHNLEPVFYVVEAQWMHPNIEMSQYEHVSRWGLVKEEVSHTKAIIRNIQRDNRWYRFRVAAVTRHGHSAFAMTRRPFRLTNQSQILSTVLDPPKNFSVKGYQLNSDTMNITLYWRKPDLPVSGYQISWESETDQSSLVNSLDISSSLSPMEFTIPFLSLDKAYLFKIRSIIISEGNRIQMSLPVLITYHYDGGDDDYSLKDLRISAPYFFNGLIKANLSWTASADHRVRQYDIHWTESECHSDVLSCCYGRDAVTTQNSFQLYDLRYNCTYLVNIKPMGSAGSKIFDVSFNVSSCERTDVYGSIHPPCQIDRRTVDTFSSLPPIDLLVKRNRSGLMLFWHNVHSLAQESSVVSVVNDLVYQLTVRQSASQDEIVTVMLPTSVTNYFLPYSTIDDNRYLNVTLSLIDGVAIRQQQSILISERKEDYLAGSLNVHSSASLNTVHFVLLFLSYGLIRWR